MKKLRGFTLVEIMLVIAIVLTVGFLAGLFPLRFISRMDVQDCANELRSVLRKAEVYAMAGRQHSAWGVHYGNATLTLFKGDSYDNREKSFDEKTAINEKVSISGFTEAVFLQSGGRPREAIPNMTVSWNGSAETVSLNSEGAIE